MNFRLVISVSVGVFFAAVVAALTLLGCNAYGGGESVPGATCLESTGGWNVVASFIFPTFASLFLLNLIGRRDPSQEQPLGARQLAALGVVSVAMAAAAFGGALELSTPSFQSDPAWLGFRELGMIGFLSSYSLSSL